MQEFLKTVAIHYAQKAQTESQGTGLPDSFPLSSYLFCFPNRRCGLFFAKYLHEAFGGTCFVPSITTIDELYGLFSQRQVPDRTSLLFRLYSIYRRLSQRPDKEEFDQFVFWGDMLLSDFDDVDKYLVDADALFRNVKDLKEIEEEFAGYDPEIVKVIQSFWRNYKPQDCPDDAKREAFGQTWSILLPLYQAFREDLAKDNLAYQGMLQREVVESIYGQDIDIEECISRPDIRKVVFVGLTAISKVDRKLMLKLKQLQMAEFCWDYADSRLRRSASKATSAAYFTEQNLLDFPNELSDEVLSAGLVSEEDRKYELYAVPSAVGQTRLANKLLCQWQENIKQNPLHTAVVLPDEKLLLPMLYSVPNQLGTFNVTMGYGLQETPIAAFVDLLVTLHDACREKNGESVSFYYRPVLAILSHNFVRTLAGEAASDLTERITRNNIFQVSIEEFQCAELLRLIFRPLRNANDTAKYLLEILAYILSEAQKEIEQQAKEDEEPTLFAECDSQLPPFTVTDHEFLYHYNQTVEKLQEELNRQSFTFTPHTLFLLLQRLVAGVSVPFSGEPLQGIQVMGVLETRGMDFENVIILSMNEGVFPAKPSYNTFIPMSLRNAFAMPTQKHRDAVFAYHFYRLISRAHHVAMIYDSRTDGMQSGEESRYVKQLRFLMGHPDLQPEAIHSDIFITDSQTFQVEKTPEVMARMKCFLGQKGTQYLSATSFIDYLQCSLRFYLAYVEGLIEDDEVTEGVNNRYFGDIFHYALCHLYEKCEGKRVDADMLRYYIEHPEGEITRQIHKGYEVVMGIRSLEGYNLLVSHILTRYVVETLRHDMKRCPFIYLKGESKQRLIYHISDELQVRIKCIYDRLERSLQAEDGVRIIDYKTGNSQRGGKLNARSIEELFKPEGKAAHEAFQVMFYCLLLNHASTSDLQSMNLEQLPKRITPHLFFVRDFRAGADCPTLLNLGKDENKELIQIEDFSIYYRQVSELFEQLVKSIFDPTQPFTQCKDTRQCLYCKFNSICKR